MLIIRCEKSISFKYFAKLRYYFEIGSPFLVKKSFVLLILLFWLHFMCIIETNDKVDLSKLYPDDKFFFIRAIISKKKYTFAKKYINVYPMKRFIPFLPWLGGLLLIAVALLGLESHLLWKIQQYNLFLDTSLFFREQMLVPGGILSYLGCYFTQFFYHPWMGVLMLSGWWLLLMWSTKQAFRIADNWSILALVPVVVLLIANMCLGYWHYFIRVHGYFFVPTIGITGGVAMLWLFRVLPRTLWIGIIAIIISAIIGYPLLGIYGLVAVMLMGIWTWRLSANRWHAAILTGVALFCIIAVPLICYRYVYYQTYFDELWTAALPITNVMKSYHVYYIPYYIIGAYFLLLTVFYQTPLFGKWQKPLYRWSLQGALAIALIAGIWHWWYKGANFHHELVMQHCIEGTDWEGVINEGRKQFSEPSRTIIMMRNIALSRLGRQTEEMYDFPWGRLKGDSRTPFDMLNVVFSRTIFYHYGLLNDCHRKCMEDGVEFGWRVETLQYLARCSILSGEKQAARKALDKLRHTKYYGEWADKMQQLLDNPRQRAQDSEMGPVRHMLQLKNAFGLDENNVERYVMNVLAYQDSNDPFFQEQAVLATLWKRNPDLFWGRFSRYMHMFPHGPIPRIFQEAAYLFGKMGKGPNPDLLPIEKGVKDTYNAFAKEGKKYDGQQAIVGRTALYPFFGNTYYFYYYFLEDMK